MLPLPSHLLLSQVRHLVVKFCILVWSSVWLNVKQVWNFLHQPNPYRWHLLKRIMALYSSSLCQILISPHSVSAFFSAHTMSMDRRQRKASILGWVALSTLLTCTAWGKSHSLCWRIALQFSVGSYHTDGHILLRPLTDVCNINPVLSRRTWPPTDSALCPLILPMFHCTALVLRSGQSFNNSMKVLCKTQHVNQTLKNILLLSFLIVFRSLISAKRLSSSMTPQKSWSGRRLYPKPCIQMPSMP